MFSRSGTVIRYDPELLMWDMKVRACLSSHHSSFFVCFHKENVRHLDVTFQFQVHLVLLSWIFFSSVGLLHFFFVFFKISFYIRNIKIPSNLSLVLNFALIFLQNENCLHIFCSSETHLLANTAFVITCWHHLHKIISLSPPHYQSYNAPDQTCITFITFSFSTFCFPQMNEWIYSSKWNEVEEAK